MHFNLKRLPKLSGVQLIMLTIVSFFMFWAMVTIFFPATILVTLVDTSEGTTPAPIGADDFKVYLVEYPDEKDSKHIELTPGAEEKVPSGVYHLQIYHVSSSFFENNRVLLYDKHIILSGFTRHSVELHYKFYITSPEFELPRITL